MIESKAAWSSAESSSVIPRRISTARTCCLALAWVCSSIPSSLRDKAVASRSARLLASRCWIRSNGVNEEDSEQDETRQPSPAALFSDVAAGLDAGLAAMLAPAGDGACSGRSFGMLLMSVKSISAKGLVGKTAGRQDKSHLFSNALLLLLHSKCVKPGCPRSCCGAASCRTARLGSARSGRPRSMPPPCSRPC